MEQKDMVADCYYIQRSMTNALWQITTSWIAVHPTTRSCLKLGRLSKPFTLLHFGNTLQNMIKNELG